MRPNHCIACGLAALMSIAAGGTLAAQRGSGEKPTGPPPNPVHYAHRSCHDDVEGHAGVAGVPAGAMADAKVAATHAGYMQKSPDNLDSIKLHAGHVINALDPSVEPKGPGSGYGVKKAAAGALQHLQLAAKSEGASKSVLTHTEHVSASLENVGQWTDAAIATAQKIRAATSAAAAATLVTELTQQLTAINSGMDAQQGWKSQLADRRRRARAGSDAHGVHDEGGRTLVRSPKSTVLKAAVAQGFSSALSGLFYIR